LWKIETDNYVNGTPALANNSIVFGGCDGIIRIADPLTGKEKDTIEIGVYIAASPALSGGKAYFGDYDGAFYCLDLTTRKVLWEIPADGNSGSILSFLQSETMSFIIYDKYIYCHNTTSGSLSEIQDKRPDNRFCSCNAPGSFRKRRGIFICLD
jgi:outer membrane protein assembly factor BamB